MKVDLSAMAIGMVTVVGAAAAAVMEAATRTVAQGSPLTITWQSFGISPHTFWLPAQCCW